jgi:hypothetical protein
MSIMREFGIAAVISLIVAVIGVLSIELLRTAPRQPTPDAVVFERSTEETLDPSPSGLSWLSPDPKDDNGRGALHAPGTAYQFRL